MDAQSLRLLLVARAQLVSQRQAIANTLRGLLKAFGHVVRKGAGGLFARRVQEVCDGNPALCAIVEPMLAVWQSLSASRSVSLMVSFSSAPSLTLPHRG